MNDGKLYNVYSDLLNFLPFIDPKIIRQYDREFLLFQIVSDKDIHTLKIVHYKDGFCVEISNFNKGYNRTIITSDVFKCVEDLFIEFNELDSLSIEALNASVNCNIDRYTENFTEDHIVYNIIGHIIDVKVIDNSFEVVLTKFDYISKSYKFNNAYEVFRFISFIIIGYIIQYFNNRNDMMLDLILDLYMEYGYKNVFIRDNDDEDAADISIRLKTPNGDMYFSYDFGNILCEFYQELAYERVYHHNILETCDDVLDWIAAKNR